jgi:hypothetical protein
MKRDSKDNQQWTQSHQNNTSDSQGNNMSNPNWSESESSDVNTSSTSIDKSTDRSS